MREHGQAALEGVAGEIEEAIGRQATLTLIAAQRNATGRSWRVCFYVPKRLPVDHQLVEILGWHTARRLCRAFGGEIVQTSNLRSLEREWRDRVIVGLNNGTASDPSVHPRPPAMSVSEIAEALGISVWRVRQVLRANPPEDAGRGGSVKAAERGA